MSDTIIVSIITSIIGASLVTLISHFLTRKKNDAEIEKLRAETQKALADAEKTRAETSKLLSEVSSKIDKSTYDEGNRQVRILYDSKRGMTNFDFTGENATVSSDPSKLLGKGKLTVRQNTVFVERVNIEGGYLACLHRYIIDGESREFIPKNDLAAGNRKLHLSCDVKITLGQAKLSVHFMKQASYENLTEFSLKIEELNSSDDWKNVSLFFIIPSAQDTFLGFLEFDATENHTLLIRNVLLEEKV